MKSDNKKKKATTVATIEAAAEQQEEKAVLTETADNAAETVETAEMKTEEPAEKAKTATPKSGVSLLEKVGKAAIRKHGFREVFVTSDGMVFALSCDAKNHAAYLKNKNILKVT